MAKAIITLLYDYDNEMGYTNKSIEIDNNEIYIKEDGTISISIYENDIEELLENTGIEV